jgi:hypothetical protein
MELTRREYRIREQGRFLDECDRVPVPGPHPWEVQKVTAPKRKYTKRIIVPKTEIRIISDPVFINFN